MNMLKILSFIVLLQAEVCFAQQAIDAVIATIDSSPITLFDLSKKLKRSISLKQLSSDQEARAVLDEIISAKLIEAEAETRRLGVSDDEINQYIKEVATRNGMNQSEFEEALAKEGKTLAAYKDDIKIEILKSKLSSTYLRGSTAVTDTEIIEYAKNHGIIKAKSPKVLLRQILIDKTIRSGQAAKDLINNLKVKLEDGDDFEDLVSEFSDSPESKEGGLLGEVLLSDLDRAVFEAVSSLEEDEYSKPVENENSIRIFYLENREEPDEEEVKLDETTMEGIRKTLEQEKLQQETASFFHQKLYESHAVDKKV